MVLEALWEEVARLLRPPIGLLNAACGDGHPPIEQRLGQWEARALQVELDGNELLRRGLARLTEVVVVDAPAEWHLVEDPVQLQRCGVLQAEDSLLREVSEEDGVELVELAKAARVDVRRLDVVPIRHAPEPIQRAGRLGDEIALEPCGRALRHRLRGHPEAKLDDVGRLVGGDHPEEVGIAPVVAEELQAHVEGVVSVREWLVRIGRRWREGPPEVEGENGGVDLTALEPDRIDVGRARVHERQLPEDVAGTLDPTAALRVRAQGRRVVRVGIDLHRLHDPLARRLRQTLRDPHVDEARDDRPELQRLGPAQEPIDPS
mmetsp:Transcript_99711/g.277417  ORF Transcript_99711/g.277417 Transcript_99711/m.277417 type:complete len:319 (-) Transcript_99711:457-1413(-)